MVVCGQIRVFPQLSSIGLFGRKWAFSTLKAIIFWKYSLQELTELSMGNNVTDALLVKWMEIFTEIVGFLQLTWIGLFGTKWATLHLKNCDLQ
jgi:hypothetical protein